MSEDATAESGAAPVWRRDEVDSPCIQICVVHPGARICIGCYRTPDEIAAWSRLSPEERRVAKEALPERAALLSSEQARPSRRTGGARRRRDRMQDRKQDRTQDGDAE